MTMPNSNVEAKSHQTRAKILKAGFDEMFENGFQGMRIDAILNKTGLAKGALYHYFPNKKSLGYAVVDELVAAEEEQVMAVLQDYDDPIKANIEMLNHIANLVTSENIKLGCPVNNLIQEMAGLDEGFKERLYTICQYKIDSIATSLERGQKNGIVKNDIDVSIVACFIVSSFNGIIGAAKCSVDIELFHSLVATLTDYIEGLRA